MLLVKIKINQELRLVFRGMYHQTVCQCMKIALMYKSIF